jgi:hypothetical protein
MVGVFPLGFSPLPSYSGQLLAWPACHLTDDSATGRIKLEYIVVDIAREKRLELVKGMHALGLKFLFYIRFVYLDVRHLPHSTTNIHPRVLVSVLCIQSRFRCYRVASQVGFHFATGILTFVRREPVRCREEDAKD